MSNEQIVIRALIEYDILCDEDSKVQGIAQRAFNNGYHTLTAPQQYVLSGFMQKQCEGITDPGGYHNDCHHTLSGQNLADAYAVYSHHDAILCPECIEELSFYAHQWGRIERE